MKKRHGQILVLILLIVVVALAVGLSVASRNITNLRTSTQTEHSQRALTAAEGGIEDVLSRLSTVQVDTPQFIHVGDLTANVTVSSNRVYESTIELGEVGQIDLHGTACSSTCYIQIEWANNTNPPDSTEVDEMGVASIETVLVKLNAGVYSQSRFAFQGGSKAAQGYESGSGPWTSPTNCSTSKFTKCTQITWEAGSEILRIRPLWLKTTVRVTGIGIKVDTIDGLPIQKYDVTSQATTEIGVTRKVQVTRNVLPQLPAAFDFVLYSEGDITK